MPDVTSSKDLPDRRGGFAVWSAGAPGVGIRFVGRGDQLDRRTVLRRASGIDLPVSWAKQVHGATVLEGASGCVGEADALETDREELALAIATADCVPIVLAGPDRIAVVHAGWRGIVAGVIGETIRSAFPGPPPALAWIGPAIGRCCYEVGTEVADQVVAAAGPSARAPGRSAKPHLDLAAAVTNQLIAAGVARIRTVDACTRCLTESLWSYRREGPGAGRNYAFAWRTKP